MGIAGVPVSWERMLHGGSDHERNVVGEFAERNSAQEMRSRCRNIAEPIEGSCQVAQAITLRREVSSRVEFHAEFKEAASGCVVADREAHLAAVVGHRQHLLDADESSCRSSVGECVDKVLGAGRKQSSCHRSVHGGLQVFGKVIDQTESGEVIDRAVFGHHAVESGVEKGLLGISKVNAGVARDRSRRKISGDAANGDEMSPFD